MGLKIRLAVKEFFYIIFVLIFIKNITNILYLRTILQVGILIEVFTFLISNNRAYHIFLYDGKISNAQSNLFKVHFLIKRVTSETLINISYIFSVVFMTQLKY